MIIHWPAFRCWVTQSPSPQSLKTSTRTTSSNYISSPTFIISDRRANTLLRGKETYHPDARFLNAFAVLLRFLNRRTDKTPLFCPQVDGGHPQCHDSLQSRSCHEQQRVPSSLSRLTSFPHAVCFGWHLPFPYLWNLFFSTHIWDIYTCVHAHFGAF